MATPRGRSWRAAFLNLKDPALISSPPSLLVALQHLLSQSKMLVSAAPDLSSQEVAGDIMLLVDLTSREGMHSEDGEWSNVLGCICHLILELSCRSQLELKSSSLVTMVSFLQRIIESCHEAAWSNSIVLKDAMSNGSRNKMAVEALQVLTHVIHENGGNMSPSDVTFTLDFLLCILSYRNLEVSSTSWENIKKVQPAKNYFKSQNVENEIELQTLVFVAISNLFARAGSVVSRETWKLTIEALRKVMDFLASKCHLEEDNVMSRYYAAVLHCLQLVLSDSKGPVAEHVPGFVAALGMFFTYGLIYSSCIFPVSNLVRGSCDHKSDLSTGREVVASRKNDSGRYRPPHLRNRTKSAAHQTATNGEINGSVQPEVSVTWGFSSDSDLSDTDGSLRDGDRFKCSKARTAAILCIQALCRADPKSLHAQWTMLLPTHDVLQPRHYQATLMTCLLFDPILKTRMAAAATLATMLEGPSSVFLQVAEYKESAKSGSFTTLSSSLGQILMQLHAGLLHLVLNESHSGMLMTIFKALSLLISATPFNRLPQELLPNVISSVGKKAKELFTSLLDQSNLVAASVSCLGATLNTTLPSPQVAAMLAAELSSGTDDNQTLLSMLFSFTEPVAHPVIRFEALQALRAAIHNYPSIMSLCWHQISSTVLGLLESSYLDTGAHATSTKFCKGTSRQNLRPVDDKTMLSAVKVLDEYLRAVSGFKGTDDLLDDGPLNPFVISVLPRPIRSLPTLSTYEVKGREGCQKDDPGKASGTSQWVEALDRYLSPTLVHYAPMVRAAALTCFAGLTSSVFFSLPDSKQNFIISSIVTAASKDEVPSVRSAACRAIGVIASFPRISARNNNLEELVNVILSNTLDTSVSVRITASWALANICDSLRHNVGTVDAEKCPTIDVSPLSLLAECALRLTKDGDKIKANAVRALGNLSRFVNFSDGNPIDSHSDSCSEVSLKSELKRETKREAKPSTSSPWLERMVQSFVSCVTTGNVKVQWNVCHALRNLFLNDSIRLQYMTWAPLVYSILLLLLRDSSNFKIRIHATSALAVPSTREDYGDSFADIVQALGHTLEVLDSDQDIAPSSFKYRKTLAEQLTSTTVHIFGLAFPEDYENFNGFLTKRASFLEEWLRLTCDNIVKFASSADTKDIFREENEGDSLYTKDCLSSYTVNGEWISSQDNLAAYCIKAEGIASVKDELMQSKSNILRAIRALIEMYRYGNHQHLVAKFENLVSQIS